MTRRYRTRISLFALAIGLSVALMLSGCTPSLPPPEPTPTFRFDILGDPGENNGLTDVADFTCFSLAEADFKNVLLPDKYLVALYDNRCSIKDGLIVVSLPGFPWDISDRKSVV